MTSMVATAAQLRFQVSLQYLSPQARTTCVALAKVYSTNQGPNLRMTMYGI
jgi:hypothetical protein